MTIERTRIHFFNDVFSAVAVVGSKVSIIRRRRLRKRHVKSEVALLQTLSRLLHLVQFIKCWLLFLELNSVGLYQRSGKKTKVVALCSRPPLKVKLGIFLRRRATTVKKCTKTRDALAKLWFC